MPNYCPLCERRGIQAKIKLFQINFNETVLACEIEECPWPFGYEDFKYFPRKAGKTWSYYWNDYDTLTENNFVPASLELSLYTPPETPFNDSLKDLTDLLSPDSTIFSNTTNSSVSPIKASTHCLLDHDNYCLKNTISKNIDNKSENCNINGQNPDVEEIIHEDDQKQFCYENKLDVINIASEDSDVKGIKLDSDIICDTNIEIICDIDKEVICDTNILKTSLDNYKSVEENLIEKEEEHYYSISNHDNDQSRNNIEAPNSALNSETQINKFTEKSTIPSNLKTTRIEVNGLPVTFSYEVPNLSFNSTTVLNTNASLITAQSSTTSQSIDISSPITSINTTSKSLDKERINIYKSKKHKKFNFNILKKKPNNVNSAITAIKNIVNNKDIVAVQIQNQTSLLKTVKPSADVNKNIKVKFVKNDVDENVHENVKTEFVKNDVDENVHENVKTELVRNNVDENIHENVKTELVRNNVDKSVNNLNMEPDLNIDNILNDFLINGNDMEVNENNKITNYDEDWIQSLFN